MIINNFEVNIVSFEVPAGALIADYQSSVTLLLKPLQGFSINANNFSITTSPLPTGVDSAFFVQDGLNINCFIIYNSTAIMPNNDLIVALCAKGFAEETGVSISGVASQCSVSNTSLPSPGQSNQVYSGSGEFGSSIMVFNQTVTALPNYYFEEEPFYSISIGVVANYNITKLKSYNAAGQLIQVVFDVNYTIPAEDVSGDAICLTANAQEIYVPVVKVISYNTPLSTYTGANNGLVVSNQACMRSEGSTTSFTLVGGEGANFTLKIFLSPEPAIPSQTFSGTIPASGTFVIPAITFPSTTNFEEWVFVLEGDIDLASQPSAFKVCQSIPALLAIGSTAEIACCTGVEADYSLQPRLSSNNPDVLTTFDTATAILTYPTNNVIEQSLFYSNNI